MDKFPDNYAEWKKKTDSQKKRECILSNEILENANKFIVTESRSGNEKRKVRRAGDRNYKGA